MNLLLIHQAFVSGNEAGGTRHVELGQHLVEQGDRVTVVASQISYLTGQPVDERRGGLRRGLFYREQTGGITVLRAYAPAVLHKSFVWRVVAFLVFAVTSVWAGLRAGPVDVVMGTSPPIFQAVSALVVARLRRKPYLLEIRDLWPEFAIEMGVLRNPILIVLSRRLEGFLYRHADHLLVNSPAYRDYLIKKGIPESKISFVPNGVDVSMFDPEVRGDKFRSQFNLGDKCVVTYAGALGPANNLDVLLRVAAQLKEHAEIHFLLVGDGKDRKRLETKADRCGLRNVTFTGSLPKSEMPEVLAASDICVAILQDIPMFRTTYPNKVFDYMGAGRPTILAIDGVIRAVVEDASAGVYVRPDDVHGMAEEITKLCANPEIRRSMGQSARAFVVARFNRDDQAELFRQVLHNVASAETGGT
jgi:glycosyltransferase involved in cell wall biosynthesis